MEGEGEGGSSLLNPLVRVMECVLSALEVKYQTAKFVCIQ